MVSLGGRACAEHPEPEHQRPGATPEPHPRQRRAVGASPVDAEREQQAAEDGEQRPRGAVGLARVAHHAAVEVAQPRAEGHGRSMAAAGAPVCGGASGRRSAPVVSSGQAQQHAERLRGSRGPTGTRRRGRRRRGRRRLALGELLGGLRWDGRTDRDTGWAVGVVMRCDRPAVAGSRTPSSLLARR